MFLKKEDLKTELINWFYSSNLKGINVVTVPYRGLDLIEALFTCVKGEDTILYITDDKEYLQNMFRENGYPGKLETVTFDEALKAEGNYRLIIYDDINTFPRHTKAEMQTLLTYLYRLTEKILAYSMDRVFRNVASLEHQLKISEELITEPRFLEYKGDLSVSIPNSIYEYFDFFIKQNRKVAIMCPDEKKTEGIINYLLRVSPANSRYIVNLNETDRSEALRKLGSKNRPTLMFMKKTDDFLEYRGNMDFIFTDTESELYEYRQFLFMSLRTCLYEGQRGEVLLINDTLTDKIDMARDIVRDYNKKNWESQDIFA